MMRNISQQDENPAYLCDRQYFQNCQQQYCPWDLLIMWFNSPPTQEGFMFLPPESGGRDTMRLWGHKNAVLPPCLLGTLADPSPHALRKATWRGPMVGCQRTVPAKRAVTSQCVYLMCARRECPDVSSDKSLHWGQPTLRAKWEC